MACADAAPGGLRDAHSGRSSDALYGGVGGGRRFRGSVYGRRNRRECRLRVDDSARCSPRADPLAVDAGRGFHAFGGVSSGCPVADDDGGCHVRRSADPYLLDGLHGRRGGIPPVLRVHESVRRLDADPRSRRQSVAVVPRLGGRGAVQLPSDRPLVQGPRERPGGYESLLRNPHRRHGSCDRHLPALRLARDVADSTRVENAVAVPARRIAMRCGGRLIAGGRGREIGTASIADLAARRHGGADAGQRVDPRRHDGDRGRLSHHADARALSRRPGGAAPRGGRGRRHAAIGCPQRPGPARHQADPGLLHHEPDRLHVPGAGRRRVVGCDLSFRHACPVQIGFVPRGRNRYQGSRWRTRYLQHGRLATTTARGVKGLSRGGLHAGRGASPDSHVQQQGPDPERSMALQGGRSHTLDARRGGCVSDGRVYVSPGLRGVLRP